MQRALELTLQPDPHRLTWSRLLDDVVARHGDRTALREWSEADGDWRDTRYSGLREQARWLARGLVGAGVSKGARVAVLMPNRSEWVVASFALAWLGAVLVPVNTFATPEELDYILRHSDASLLLMQRGVLKHDFLADLTSRHPTLAKGTPGGLLCTALPSLRRIICLDLDRGQGGVEPWSVFEELGESVPESLLDSLQEEVHPSDAGLLIYTSGTTAHPKGILHGQRAAVIQSWRFAELMGLGPEDRVLTAQPFFWTAGIVMSLGASLAAGSTLILEPVFSVARFLKVVEEQRITALHAWPHQEKSMAEHEDSRSRDLTSLGKLEFASPLAELAGLERDDWGTYGSYGMSETFTLASALPAHAPADERSGTSGRPLPGMDLRIVDPLSGQPVEGAGIAGEISVRGATLMQGYYKVEPELFLDADGYFRSQDGGYLDARGFLHWTGRLSNMIKTGGANVSPLEIEQALADCEAVHVCAALGVPHATLGEIIILCVVRGPGESIDEDFVMDRLRTRLSAYKLPRRVLFPDPDQVSYTGNQKLQLEPLREWMRSQLEEAEIEGVRY